VALTVQDRDKLHVARPSAVKLLQRLDRADIDGSTVRPEMQQDRTATVRTELPVHPAGVLESELGCKGTRLRALPLPNGRDLL
jgi:hypothetical protein